MTDTDSPPERSYRYWSRCWLGASLRNASYISSNQGGDQVRENPPQREGSHPRESLIKSSKPPFIETLEVRAENMSSQSNRRADVHRLAAGFWGLVHRGLTSIAAVSAAIAGTSLLTSATGGWRIAAGILALMAAVLSALDTTLRAGQLAEEHKRGFDGYIRIRTKWVQFRYVTLGLQYTENQLAEEFQRIVAESDQLAERIPAPPQWA